MSINLQDAIRITVSKFQEHPYDINCGECENFAVDVLALIGESQDSLTSIEIETSGRLTDSDLPGHTWIKQNGIHYDAEEPNGVANWHELPLFTRLLRIPRYQGIIQKEISA